MVTCSNSVFVCFAGAGVAHTDRETEDEERGGAAGSGTGFRPCCGGLRETHAHQHTLTHTCAHSVRLYPAVNAA